MKQYTEIERLEMAERNKHIPTSEVKQDIADTEREIAQWDRERRGFELIGGKMAFFRAENRRLRIVEANEFIARLKIILEVRATGE